MDISPPVNPRRIVRTQQKREARRRQGERWRAADRALEGEVGRWLLGVDLARRRWMDDDGPAREGVAA